MLITHKNFPTPQIYINLSRYQELSHLFPLQHKIT